MIYTSWKWVARWQVITLFPSIDLVYYSIQSSEQPLPINWSCYSKWSPFGISSFLCLDDSSALVSWPFSSTLLSLTFKKTAAMIFLPLSALTGISIDALWWFPIAPRYLRLCGPSLEGWVSPVTTHTPHPLRLLSSSLWLVHNFLLIVVVNALTVH